MYGTVVRKARAERGLTQVDLARISGIGQANISAIERGRRQPSAETLHRLLLACGFELLAAAGGRVLPCPPPDDWDDGDPSPHDGGPPELPMAVRVRRLTAALDAAEAIVRSR